MNTHSVLSQPNLTPAEIRLITYIEKLRKSIFEKMQHDYNFVPVTELLDQQIIYHSTDIENELLKILYEFSIPYDANFSLGFIINTQRRINIVLYKESKASFPWLLANEKLCAKILKWLNVRQTYAMLGPVMDYLQSA